MSTIETIRSWKHFRVDAVNSATWSASSSQDPDLNVVVFDSANLPRRSGGKP